MLARWIVIVLFALSGQAFAVLTPSPVWSRGGNHNPDYSSANAACSAEVAKSYPSGGVPVTYVGTGPDNGSGQIDCIVHDARDPAGSNGAAFSVTMATGSCPANSYGTSTCTCNAGFTDSGKNSCTAVPNCKAAGTTISSGYYDTGTSMSAGPKVLVCSGGCQAIFDGTFPSGSARVGTATHYYAQGSYHAADGTCSPSDTPSISTAPTANTSVPADKCATGEVAGTINGKASCVSSTTGNGTVSSVPGNTSTSGTSVAQNSDGSSDSTTTTTTSAPDGSTSTTATVTHTNANGTAGGSTSTTTGTGATNGTGSAGAANTGAGTGSNTTPDDGSNPCKTNPAGSGCGGTPGDVPSLWTAKDKTVGTVLTNAKNTLMASGIGSGVSNFFTVQQGGTCPPSTWAIAYFHTTISVGTFCTDFAAQMFLVIRGVLLLVATFMAFRAAIE